MMTQNFSYSRILAVWLVLLAFFCGMILPSIAIARMEFTIATEGDPGDGMDSDSGGGGGSGGSDNETTPVTGAKNISQYWIKGKPISRFGKRIIHGCPTYV